MNYYSRPQSDGPFQAPIPASVAEGLLDSEQITDLLHEAELRESAIKAERNIIEIIEKASHTQVVDGVSMSVSNTALKGTTPDGLAVYARVYETTDKDSPIRRGIVFDVTPDSEVVTTNVSGIMVSEGTIVVGSEFNAGIEVAPAEEVYTYVTTVVGTILKEITDKEQAKQRAKQARRDEVVSFLVDVVDVTKEVTAEGAKFMRLPLAVGTTTFFSILILSSLDELPEITDVGTSVSIGEAASPAYSDQLRNSDELESDDIYVIPGNSFDEGDVREFVLDSSKSGVNCKTHRFESDNRPSRTTYIEAWTDAVNADGTPRNNEIVVTYTVDELTACWVKDTEKNADDDLRVAVQRVDPFAEATN